ncbi:uncharacterized protein LOC106476487 [Limulus polyphemus]|uniref:Uncharacterized protein LOC106476487 n=1 Tax=Limulus polyphemus TaxID=6850 RepID=A0ABM1RXE8_LIMPO|nr:uncharacterized protein LOC106476487 [Limulus polyphemus]
MICVGRSHFFCFNHPVESREVTVNPNVAVLVVPNAFSSDCSSEVKSLDNDLRESPDVSEFESINDTQSASQDERSLLVQEGVCTLLQEMEGLKMEKGKNHEDGLKLREIINTCAEYESSSGKENDLKELEEKEDQEVCSSTCTNQKVCSSSCTDQKVCSSSCTDQKVCSSSCTDQEVCSSSCTDQEVCSSSCTNQEVCSSSCTDQEVCSSSCTDQEVCSSSCTDQEVCSSSCTDQEVCSSSCTDQEVCSSTCTDQEVCSSTCIDQEVCSPTCTDDASHSESFTLATSVGEHKVENLEEITFNGLGPPFLEKEYNYSPSYNLPTHSSPYQSRIKTNGSLQRDWINHVSSPIGEPKSHKGMFGDSDSNVSQTSLHSFSSDDELMYVVTPHPGSKYSLSSQQAYYSSLNPSIPRTGTATIACPQSPRNRIRTVVSKENSNRFTQKDRDDCNSQEQQLNLDVSLHMKATCARASLSYASGDLVSYLKHWN